MQARLREGLVHCHVVWVNALLVAFLPGWLLRCMPLLLLLFVAAVQDPRILCRACSLRLWRRLRLCRSFLLRRRRSCSLLIWIITTLRCGFLPVARLDSSIKCCVEVQSDYITLHYITLYYIILHYITLHYITSGSRSCAELPVTTSSLHL